MLCITAEKNMLLLSKLYGNYFGPTCSNKEQGPDKSGKDYEPAGRCVADKSPYFTFNTPADIF
jgi:hypothetical protein